MIFPKLTEDINSKISTRNIPRIKDYWGWIIFILIRYIILWHENINRNIRECRIKTSQSQLLILKICSKKKKFWKANSNSTMLSNTRHYIQTHQSNFISYPKIFTTHSQHKVNKTQITEKSPNSRKKWVEHKRQKLQETIEQQTHTIIR